MSRLVAGLAAAALLAAPMTASAQNKTVIRNSGNGANNTIAVKNGARPGFPPPPIAYQPQVPAYPAGYGPAGYGGYGPAGYGGGILPAPPAPGFNRNVIRDSGNGVDNTIAIRNGGGWGYQPGGYPFGPGGFGVNINVVTNSGNGVGNTVSTFNRGGPGGVNINVITNSGNGAGNTIGIKNR
jgi:hypothetical protein